MKRMRPDLNTGNTIKQEKNVISAWLLSGLFGVLSGLFFVLGYQLENNDCINLSDRNAMLTMLCMMIIITVDTRYVWRNYDAQRQGAKLFGLFQTNVAKEPGGVIESSPFTSADYLITWGALALMNLPVLLAEFPGFFVYDAQDELSEVLTRSFSTHHPLLHVLLLGGIIAFVHKATGSWNLGIFTYIVFQMLIITAIFAYTLMYLHKRGIGKRSRILWTLYYGLFPTIVMYTLCSSKDGLFSAFLLLLTVLLAQLTDDPALFIQKKSRVAALCITAFLMPCFRHNGFYAYLVFIPFGLIYLWKHVDTKKLFGKLSVLLVIPVIAYLVFNSVLAAVFASEGTHHQEMLTVPIMQMARVCKYDRQSMSQEDIDTLVSYIPEANLEKYTERVSDLVKVDFNNEYYEQNKAGFWGLWWKLFKKHPIVYLNAWLLTSYGYVYPPANINVYKGGTMFTFTYEHSSYFGYEVEQPGERHSFIPVIDSLYRYLSIGTFHDDAKVLYLLFSPGMMLLIYLFVLLYRLRIRDFKGIIPFLPMVLTFLTVLLGPTYLVRYVVYLWLCLPLLLCNRRLGAAPAKVV
ncbi:DUF6020 family protein [Butyrivibrio sp. DSM 10294]|uniref:DUF6020 family protein n=1 Tax=Butyrivibrio sp. DSM 10294 TaxID=2972457 RepID=UPI00234E5B10|nr:DUF6020 family protein [Butyrivibrio sp. DSM 10294]MDC7292960.1 DUF6020 family protein [Butyrivibrio sp. DSM 10294]